MSESGMLWLTQVKVTYNNKVIGKVGSGVPVHILGFYEKVVYFILIKSTHGVGSRLEMLLYDCEFPTFNTAISKNALA
jgi:hypothetical protein